MTDRTKNNVVGTIRHAVSCRLIQTDGREPCDCTPIDDSKAWDVSGVRTMNFTCGLQEPKIVYALESELERLRAVDKAAKALIDVVRATPDHTEWFKPLSDLMRAINQ